MLCPTQMGGIRTPFLYLALLTAGCTPSSSFEGPGYDDRSGVLTDHPGPFIVVVTHTKAHEAHLDAFDRSVDAIVEQAKNTDGFVGSSVRGEVFGLERWTLTAWESDAAFAHFYGGGAHQTALSKSHDLVEGVYSARFMVDRADMPPTGEDALLQLDVKEPVDPV
jgi:hypothetical protein